MPDKSLLYFRREYLSGTLHRKDLPQDPYQLFMDWIDDAIRSGIDDPTAMSLATADASGRPSVRIVLLKDARPEGFVFYSNYESNKGHALAVNPQASVMFFWPGLDRQVRIEGMVQRTSREESDDFFNARPRSACISSIISQQSKVIADRAFLEGKFDEFRDLIADSPVKRPDFWGGYILKPDSYEFWQGRENRLNDRILYTLIDGNWNITRLAP
ncbi:MAG: pyridoxamine 5'-phosphate oxidase [Bacteroidota bacterium]